LAWYSEHALLEPIGRLKFIPSHTGATAKLHWTELGWTRVFAKPDETHTYALAADVATGRGMDYSAAYVIDLTSMAFAAEFHAKIDSDEFAEQLHFLGRWYGSARLAVEMGGGYGEPVIIALRDGRKGRPHYPKLYRHAIADRADMHQLANYGFPMNTKTRPTVINGLEQAIRERTIPALPRGLLMELRTFVRQRTLPSPRAQDGSNDDRVMAAGIALELYRQYGTHEKRHRPPVRKGSRHRYPWEKRRVA